MLSEKEYTAGAGVLHGEQLQTSHTKKSKNQQVKFSQRIISQVAISKGWSQNCPKIVELYGKSTIVKSWSILKT